MTGFKQKGFTLLEILIAILILALVLTTIYASYRGTFKIISLSEKDSDIYSMARGAMDRMVTDLKAAARYNGAIEFTSDRRNFSDHVFSGLVFRSASHISFNENEPPAGISLIGYTVEESEGQGGFVLIRSDDLSSEANKDGGKKTGLVLCEKVEALTFKYYDHSGKEYDSWSSLRGSDEQKNKAPAMVSIQLELTNAESKDSPHKFMTKVFLPLSNIDHDNKQNQ